MPARVAVGVLLDLSLVAVRVDDHSAVDLPDPRIVELDPAVDQADAGALPGGLAERPLTRHAVGPSRGERDALGFAHRKAPGGKLVDTLSHGGSPAPRGGSAE